MSLTKARDEFYENLASLGENVSQSPFFPSAKSKELTVHAQQGGIFKRIRFITQFGYICKATFLQKPAIVRLSFGSAGRINGPGVSIKYWDKQNGQIVTRDVLFSVFFDDDRSFSQAEFKQKIIIESNFLISFFQYNLVLFSFWTTGFNPYRTFPTLPNGKTLSTNDILQVHVDVDNFQQLLTMERLPSWKVSLNGKKIGYLNLETINSDDSFGYSIQFNHHLRKAERKPLAQPIPQLESLWFSARGIVPDEDYFGFEEEKESVS